MVEKMLERRLYFAVVIVQLYCMRADVAVLLWDRTVGAPSINDPH